MSHLTKLAGIVALALTILAVPMMAGEVNAQTSYTVEPGDSLWKISNRFDVSLDELRAENNYYTDLIYPGQTFTIPSTSQTTATETREQQSSYQRIQVSQYEKNLMAHAVYSEARGEIYEGQVAVAAVIINRVQDNRWPNNVEGVIFEPWAFTAVHDGQFWLQPNSTAYDAVEDALAGWDPSDGAVFYYNPVTATSDWIFTRTRITSIGKHVFAY